MKNNIPKIYFAAPLFSEADKMYNLKVVNQLKESLHRQGLKAELYVPQLNEGINDKEAYASAEDIVQADYSELTESDILVALLDGEDSGVALEAGIAYERGMGMVGLWTDSRQQGGTHPKKIEALQQIGQNQFAYINLMLSGLFLNREGLYNDQEEFIESIITLVREETKK